MGHTPSLQQLGADWLEPLMTQSLSKKIDQMVKKTLDIPYTHAYSIFYKIGKQIENKTKARIQLEIKIKKKTG